MLENIIVWLGVVAGTLPVLGGLVKSRYMGLRILGIVSCVTYSLMQWYKSKCEYNNIVGHVCIALIC